MSSEFKLIDVCHTVEHGMITYKGLPAPVISDFLSREDSATRYAPGTEFHIGKIEMVANTGTYLDSPFHRYASGKHPYLTEGAATYLAKNSAALVGIDSFNIDATRDGNRPAHSV